MYISCLTNRCDNEEGVTKQCLYTNSIVCIARTGTGLPPNMYRLMAPLAKIRYIVTSAESHFEMTRRRSTIHLYSLPDAHEPNHSAECTISKSVSLGVGHCFAFERSLRFRCSLLASQVRVLSSVCRAPYIGRYKQEDNSRNLLSSLFTYRVIQTRGQF